MAQSPIGDWNPWEKIQSPLRNEEETERIQPEIIPPEASAFYDDFGHLTHSKTGQEIKQLADYQLRIWNDKSKYRLVIKSQKVGISTSVLLEDFQKALTTCKGKDILVIAQTQEAANEHLLTLKTLIINSEKYRKYLIIDSSEMTFKEEKTKLSEIHIKNPDNPRLRTRIIARGPSQTALWSWKQIAHIHMSDIAVNNLKDDSEVFSAALSRLATTDGTVIIETPPRGPFKKTFEIYQQSLVGEKNPEIRESLFHIHHVYAFDAVRANVMTQQFLDAEKIRLGPTLYAQNYEAQFIAASGNLFNQGAIDKALLHEYNPDEFRPQSIKYIVADQGYQSSAFAIIVAEWEPRVSKIRILAAEEHRSPTFEQMINRIFYLRDKFKNVVNIGYDATNRMEFGSTLLQKMDKPYRIDYIKQRLIEAKGSVTKLKHQMIVVPIIFTSESKSRMTEHTRRILEDPRQFIAINPQFVNLITALRTAVFDERGQLDKERSAHDDLTDAFFMLCEFFFFGQG